MMKILIVDDSSVARRMLIKCIPSENIEIHEAGNGQEGIEKFSEIKPDVITSYSIHYTKLYEFAVMGARGVTVT